MGIFYTPFFRKLRYVALDWVISAALLFIKILPRSFGLWFFGLVGTIAFLIPHSDRRRTLNHLTFIFGKKWSRKKIVATARGVYRELGKNMFDAFLLPRLNASTFHKIVSHDPIDPVLKAYNEGRGGIMITAHTGCFEMLLHFFPMHGLKTFAIGKKLRSPKLDNIIRQNRSGNKTFYMDRSESPRKIVRYLQEGMLFGVLIDQDTAVEGVFADFLGEKAYTPSGPIKMAMKLGVPVFVVTSARQPDNTHHVTIKGPIPLKTSDSIEQDIIDNVTIVNNYISSAIEAYPEQWVWMHRRWQRKPSLEDLTGGAVHE